MGRIFKFEIPDKLSAKDRADLRRLYNVKNQLLENFSEKRNRLAYADTIREFIRICDRNGLHPLEVERALEKGQDPDKLERWLYGCNQPEHIESVKNEDEG